MPRELWRSGIGGQRRKGTRLSELHTVLGSGINAFAILEPLVSVAADADAAAAARYLRERGFDVAGVTREADGRVAGYVEVATLWAGTVADHMKHMTVDCLIADSTPLPEALAFLRDREFTFVLVGSEASGIITRADLNKPPVRVYLFGLISLLEMHMAHWIRVEYGNESWRDRLTAARLESAVMLQEERKKRNEEIDLVECLQFCDKRDLVIAHDDLRRRLGLGAKSEGRRLLKRAERLRDLLAHSQRDLVQGTTWEDLIDLIQKVESVLERSDDLIEAAIARA